MTPPTPAVIRSLVVACPTCGTTETHRVLHVSAFREGSHAAGVARCARCHTTHPFEVSLRRLTVRVVVSEGRASQATELSMDPDRRLAVGDRLEETERRLIVSRIETTKSASAPWALAKEVRTVWAVPGDVAHVKVSIGQGSVTVPALVTMDPEHPIRVGDQLRIGRSNVVITAIRLAGRTLDREGEGERALEVRRAYARPVRSARPARSFGRPMERESSWEDREPRERRGPQMRRRSRPPPGNID